MLPTKNREGPKISTVVTPSNATNKSLSYSTTNEDVLAVDEGGTVTAKKKGKADIVVTSKDNQQASDAISFNVVEAEDDDVEFDDEDAIDPEAIDVNHENVVDYRDSAVVIQDAQYTVDSNGVVAIEADKLPSGLNPGDVVVFEPTNENPNGATVKVDSDGAYDGTLAGGEPVISDVYDSIDIEAVGIVASDGFIPESDVELLDVEEASLDEEGPADTTVIYPQSTASAKPSRPSNKDGLTLQAATIQSAAVTDNADDVKNLGVANVGTGIKTMSVDVGGKSTSKFKLRYKGLTFTIKPTGTLKYNYDLSGINSLYVSVKIDESLSTTAKLSTLFGEEPLSKKLGSVTFATSVPGLFLEGSLWFHLEADGKLTFSLEASQELGVKYTKAKGCEPINEYSCNPKLSLSAELNTGIDFVGTVKMCAIKVVDPSLQARFTLGIDTADTKTRDNGTLCNDIKLKFSPSISVGTHEGLFKDLGISYQKKFGPSVVSVGWEHVFTRPSPSSSPASADAQVARASCRNSEASPRR